MVKYGTSELSLEIAPLLWNTFITTSDLYPIEHNVITAIKNLTLAFMIDHYITKNIGLQRFQEHTYVQYPLSKHSAPFKSKNQNALKEKPEKIAPII